MYINKFSPSWNLIFWTTHFVSLSGLILPLFLMTPIIEGFTFGVFHNTVSFLEFVFVFFLLGILRIVLNSILDWKNITLGLVFKIIAFTFVYGIVMQLMLYYLLNGIVIKFFPGYTMPYMFFLGPELKFLDSVLTSFSWVIIFLTIKMIINYNVSRLETITLLGKVKQEEINSISSFIDFDFMNDAIELTKRLISSDIIMARETLTQLSDVLRYNLNQVNFEFVTVQEELVMVRNYINLIGGHYNNDLIFDENISADFLNVLIKPMTFQNVVKKIVNNSTALINIEMEGVEYNEYKIKFEISNNQKGCVINNKQLHALFSKDEQLELMAYENKFTIIFKLMYTVSHNIIPHE